MATVAALRPSPPDIDYKPDMAEYLARIKRRHETEKLETTLPGGFRAQLESKLVWKGENLAKAYNWNRYRRNRGRAPPFPVYVRLLAAQLTGGRSQELT